MGDRLAIRRTAFVGDEVIEQTHFGCGQRKIGRRIGSGAVEHRHPEDAPTDNAEDRYQVDEPLCVPQL